MSACEKCWSDARRISPDVAAAYRQLIAERSANPCTPEEQAGPDATECPIHKRMTCHQYTGECMVQDCRHGVKSR